VRSLLSPAKRRPSGGRGAPARRAALGRQRAVPGSGIGEGRWSLLPEPDLSGTGPATGPPAEEVAEAVAWQLLARWGVVAWELWTRESFRIPWRDVVRALRRLEARGQVLGGRFVAGISGEQYALPEAAALLADVRRDPARGADVTVAGADPLNLTGDLLGGSRVPAIRYRSVYYRDGEPAVAAASANGR
jgi:ATP-dependent Lhr-like helicase